MSDVHCMHPNFLQNQLERSLENLGLETLDLMYLHNPSEGQAAFLRDDKLFFNRLAVRQNSMIDFL